MNIPNRRPSPAKLLLGLAKQTAALAMDYRIAVDGVDPRDLDRAHALGSLAQRLASELLEAAVDAETGRLRFAPPASGPELPILAAIEAKATHPSTANGFHEPKPEEAQPAPPEPERDRVENDAQISPPRKPFFEVVENLTQTKPGHIQFDTVDLEAAEKHAAINWPELFIRHGKPEHDLRDIKSRCSTSTWNGSTLARRKATAPNP